MASDAEPNCNLVVGAAVAAVYLIPEICASPAPCYVSYSSACVADTHDQRPFVIRALSRHMVHRHTWLLARRPAICWDYLSIAQSLALHLVF
eukprot:scaffold29674_cov26-Tisochrysis_lutea.AAC.4